MSKEKYRVLIITGKPGMDHDPRVNEWLRTMLEASGSFDVYINEDFTGCTAEMLAGYDCALVNYFGPRKDGRFLSWGDTADKALLDFVRAGKGVVFYHASVFVANDISEDYRKMVGVDYSHDKGFRKSPKLDMVVDFRYGDPITDGLAPASWGTPCDDLFVPAGIRPDAENLKVLATVYDAVEDYDLEAMQKHIRASYYEGGVAFEDLPNINRDQPVAWTNTYGDGRVLCVTIGHGPDTIRRPPFVAFMCRGVEWACSGQVTIEPPDLQFDNRYRVWPYYLNVNTRDIARMLKT